MKPPLPEEDYPVDASADDGVFTKVTPSHADGPTAPPPFLANVSLPTILFRFPEPSWSPKTPAPPSGGCRR